MMLLVTLLRNIMQKFTCIFNALVNAIISISLLRVIVRLIKTFASQMEEPALIILSAINSLLRIVLPK